MLTVEQSKFVTDLRQKAIKNVQEGKQANAEISPEELRQALSYLRQNRAQAGAAGAEAKTAKKRKAVDPEVNKKIQDAFGDLD